MKRVFPFLFIMTVALSCAYDHPNDDQNIDLTNDQESQQDDGQRVPLEAGDNVFYILKSRAGIPESSTFLAPGVEELKPYQAQISVFWKEDEGVADIKVDYAFRYEFDEEVAHVFSLNLTAIPVTCQEDLSLQFDVNSLTGTFLLDGEAAEYRDASVSGRLGEEGSNLYFEGILKNYPFFLKVLLASLSEEAFVPEYMENVISEYLPLYEIEITNETSDEVSFSIQNQVLLSEYEVAPGETEGTAWTKDWMHVLKNESTIAPGETHLVQIYMDQFPSDLLIEITFGEDQAVVLSGDEILSSDCLSVDWNLEECHWYPFAESTGAINSRQVGYEHLTIK